MKEREKGERERATGKGERIEKCALPLNLPQCSLQLLLKTLSDASLTRPEITIARARDETDVKVTVPAKKMFNRFSSQFARKWLKMGDCLPQR